MPQASQHLYYIKGAFFVHLPVEAFSPRRIAMQRSATLSVPVGFHAYMDPDSRRIMVSINSDAEHKTSSIVYYTALRTYMRFGGAIHSLHSCCTINIASYVVPFGKRHFCVSGVRACVLATHFTNVGSVYLSNKHRILYRFQGKWPMSLNYGV